MMELHDFWANRMPLAVLATFCVLVVFFFAGCILRC
jgi:hypothetical protein